MPALTLADVQTAARALGITMAEAKRLRRQFLAEQFLARMLDSRYGDPVADRARARWDAEEILAVAHREEDTLYTRGGG